MGYGIFILIPILLIRFFECFWFRLSHKKWHIYQELTVSLFGFLLIAIVAYFHNIFIVNNLNIVPEKFF